jgi:hypothetical protein
MSRAQRLNALLLGAAVLAASTIGLPTAAHASEQPGPFSAVNSTALPTITADDIRRAVSEARENGAVTSTAVSADGTRTTTIAVQAGSIELVEPGVSTRLGAGSDKNGAYVDFNQYDQGVILGGAGIGLAAGLCLLGPAVCVIANAAILLATTAITTHHLQCGSRVMRVHLSGKPGPKCV